MAKIQCYNCRRETPIVAPNYRCKHCNYPLNKYIQSQESPKDETIIDNPDSPDPSSLADNIPPVIAEPKAAELTLNDLFQKNVDDSLRDIKEVLSQLKPDEKIEKLILYWSAKEALYKLYGKGEIAFTTQLLIEPFNLSLQGELKAAITGIETPIEKLTVHYRFFNDHVLTYVCLA